MVGNPNGSVPPSGKAIAISPTGASAAIATATPGSPATTRLVRR